MKSIFTRTAAHAAAFALVVATSAAAVAQQAPPDLCHEDAVSQCNYGSWEAKGYASEQQCVADNSMYCNDREGGGGNNGGGGVYRDVQPRPCASRIPGNCL